MSAIILDGKKLADEILSGLKEEIKDLNKKIKLGIVLVGDDAVSLKYIEKKIKAGGELGIEVKVYKYDKDITTKKLREEVGRICRLPNMGGVLIQLPLPSHINTQGILDAVLPQKDIDVLGAKAFGKFYAGKSPIMPPTVAGILKLLEEVPTLRCEDVGGRDPDRDKRVGKYNIEVKGRRVAVVGQGQLVGKPMSIILMQKGATVLAINEFTENKGGLIKKADIIISGVGKPGLITKDMLKEGAVVVDAGTTVENGKLVGDVAGDVKDVASYITPVPGGVGPMTVAMLFWNLVELTKR
ncbi:MAG: bifunctional 5,10-methylenetetrahydrofolate dehydrogenase/5,10-methenyltetrahydrofolate cyclohydrolase [Candidatus Spechtbacterales bacterium]